ncbi:putative sphingolipid transporter spinster-like protein 1 [Diplonema papillatum]|nr:putative sphingolipid transporter spinster-like protein 1 [Diplonema papillatum]
MIGFMVCSPLFASLGGIVRPTYLVTCGLLLWSVSCLLASFSPAYWWLVAARCLVGVGEAAYCGYIPTIIDDVAPPHRRTTYIGSYFAMIPVGMAAGMTGGGIISKTNGLGDLKGWQTVFFTEAFFMVPLAFLVFLLPHHLGSAKAEASAHSSSAGSPPSRQSPLGVPRLESDFSVNEKAGTPHESVDDAVDRAEADNDPAYTFSPAVEAPKYPSVVVAVKTLLRNPLFLLTVGGYAMYTFVLGGIATWGIMYLEQGPLRMSTEGASTAFGGITVVTGLIGTAFGGWYVDRCGGSKGHKGLMACYKFMIVMILVSIPTGLVAFAMDSLPLFFAFCFVSELTLFTTTAPVNAVLLETVPENLRTYAMAFSIFAVHALGDFPSPFLIGMVSDAFSQGCGEHKQEPVCVADTASSCHWVGDGICRNDAQLRNAMMITFGFLVGRGELGEESGWELELASSGLTHCWLCGAFVDPFIR